MPSKNALSLIREWENYCQYCQFINTLLLFCIVQWKKKKRLVSYEFKQKALD